MNKIYMFLLASLCSIELFLGIAVAPVIFFPANIVGDGVLTHFQSGLLMTQVFVKFNNLLLLVSIFSLLHELFAKQDSKNFKISRIFLSLINLICACLFIFLFTDKILEYQALGELATQSNEFKQYHDASEYVFKIMAIVQFCLFITTKYKK